MICWEDFILGVGVGALATGFCNFLDAYFDLRRAAWDLFKALTK